MDKGAPPSLFVNDGSFMERFKQLQQDKNQDQEKEKEKGAAEKDSKPKTIVLGTLTPKPSVGKITMQFKANDARKTPQAASGGKLAFSLKQKSKLVAPAVKLGADEEDEDEADAGIVSGDASAKRQKLAQPDASEQSSRQLDVGNYYLYRYPHFWLSCNGMFSGFGLFCYFDLLIVKITLKIFPIYAFCFKCFDSLLLL